jgi:hypothetical protein
MTLAETQHTLFFILLSASYQDLSYCWWCQLYYLIKMIYVGFLHGEDNEQVFYME